MNACAGRGFSTGLDRFEARKQAAAKLEALGLLIEREPYENTVGFSERGDVPIEPRLFRTMVPPSTRKSKEAKRAVEQWHHPFPPGPLREENLPALVGRHSGLVHQPASSWWGHRIPVWVPQGASTARASILPDPGAGPRLGRRTGGPGKLGAGRGRAGHLGLVLPLADGQARLARAQSRLGTDTQGRWMSGTRPRCW